MYYAVFDNIIRNELDKGRRIAIYPFGKIGMQARDILVSRYGQEAILIDNSICKFNQHVIGINEFAKIDAEDITVILATDTPNLNKELSRQIAQMKLKASVINFLEHLSIVTSKSYKNDLAPKYCVLQRIKGTKCGLFSFFIVFLGGINYCIKNNRIPIVDMMTYNNIYQNGEGINSWELFFEQPMKVRLEEIENAEYLNCDIIMERPNDTMDFLTNGNKVRYWQEICKKYIRLNKDTKEYIDQYLADYLPKGKEKETIGVLCRGTDYINLKPHRHPVQPDIDMMIDKVKEYLEKYQCNYIFLATEDKHISETFQKEFGNQLIVPDSVRYEDTNNNYLADIIVKQGDAYEKGREYLASVYALSRCRCMIAGRTSGSVGALILSDGFEDMYMWNLGYYGIDTD